MSLTSAVIASNGSCVLGDADEVSRTVWQSVSQWAEAWLREQRLGQHAAASEFAVAVCAEAVPGVVESLVAVAEAATNEEELIWLGAGPLEDLVSHSGNGQLVLADVDRAARQNRAFRTALAFTWLGNDVPAPVRDGLGELGARLLPN